MLVHLFLLYQSGNSLSNQEEERGCLSRRLKKVDDINCGLQRNKVKKLERTELNSEIKKTECRSTSGHDRYFRRGKKVYVWRDGVASNVYPENRLEEACLQLEEQGKNYRRTEVITQGPFINENSRTEEENSLNIKITSAFSLKTDMSLTSFRDKDLPQRLNHPQQTRIQSVGKELSSRFSPCTVLRQQQKQPIKSKLPNQSEHRRAFLAIKSNSLTGPRCFEVQKEAKELSWSNGKHNTEQQGYTKQGKSREFDSANLNGVWSNPSLTNEDDTYPLKISLYTGSPNYCNISSESGPSILFHQDHDTKSLSFTSIRRTKRTREHDESIASDMITHGMPSLLSTTSGEHYLPMALSSHTSNNSNKQLKSIPQKQLVNYNANVFLPWRFQNMSPDSLHELNTTKEALAQLQQSNVHPCISQSRSNDNAAVSLKVIYRGKQELERPFNLSSVDSKRKFSRMQFFMTPAPETLMSLKTMGLENDEEPIVKIPNYFLDFISEDRPNDHLAPKLGPQKGYSSFDKGLCKSGDSVAKKDMNARQTKTMPRQNVSMETKVLSVVKPSKTRVGSSPEKAADTRHVTFSPYYSEGHTCVSKSQVNAGASNTTVTEIPRRVRTWQDACQGKVPILTLPLKMAGNARSSNEVHTTSEFSDPLSQSTEAKCERVTNQVLVVSNGANTGKCYQCDLHQKPSIIKKSPPCSGEEFTRKIMQKRRPCTALERKHSLSSREDEVSLSSAKHLILTEQETRVESPEKKEEFPLNRKRSISKDLHFLPELHSFGSTDTTKTEEFVHHSSSHGLWSLSNDNVMISTCTQTSSAAQHSTALSLSKRKYQCEVCGHSFSRSNTLITHNRIHTGDRPFPCDVCGRAFRQLGNLTRHKMTHAAVKPHTCPICRKCFSRTSNLNTHMRTHTNYKPFVCDFCGKGFHQKVDMKIHRYTHTGEKPHKCNKCGRGFKQLTHLKYHMRTHSTVRLYKCEHCGKGFNQKGNLQAHIYGHTGKRPHRCEICGKGFTLTSTLNTHKRTHAPHKPFKCKYCEKAFYQKNALKTHYISSHPCTNGVCLL